MTGTDLPVITHGTASAVDRCWRVCRCSSCGAERTCTPGFDFYGDDGSPLLCERCFRSGLGLSDRSTLLVPE